jgi:hypothetical protein
VVRRNIKRETTLKREKKKKKTTKKKKKYLNIRTCVEERKREREKRIKKR